MPQAKAHGPRAKGNLLHRRRNEAPNMEGSSRAQRAPEPRAHLSCRVGASSVAARRRQARALAVLHEVVRHAKLCTRMMIQRAMRGEGRGGRMAAGRRGGGGGMPRGSAGSGFSLLPPLTFFCDALIACLC